MTIRIGHSFPPRHGKINRVREANERLKRTRICLACAGPCRCFRGIDRTTYREPIDMVEVSPGKFERKPD